MAGRMDKGRMPKDLAGLLRWYAEVWDQELPDKTHIHEVWHDKTKPWESTKPVGGSLIGTYAFSEPFRRYIEDSDSATDPDGYFERPLHAALGRMARNDQWMARTLFAVAQAGMDWGSVADRLTWPRPMFGVYVREALICLWKEYTERGTGRGYTKRAATA